MKKLTILLCFLTWLSANGQVSVSWVNYPGGVSVATDASNNVYTALWDYNPAGDITLTKRDAGGNIVWEVPYNNTNTARHEVATWVATDSQGNIVVSGTTRSGYSNPVDANSLLMKFSPSGTLLWRVVYETDFDGSSTRKCLIDAQNNIYVLGLGNSGTGIVTKVKKFSSSGTSVWSYFDTGGGAPINFKFTPDGKIVLAKRSITGSYNFYTKIDLNGNLLWNTTAIASSSTGDAAGDLNGNTYLSNYGSIKKLSATGTVIWEKTNTMTGFRVEVGNDNNPVISGFPTASTVGAAFIKYDSYGNLLWQNLDADGPSYSLLSHAQMKIDASNAIYLAASIMTNMAFCKVNSDGSTAWVVTTAGGYPAAMEFGTDNSLFVVGGATARLLQSGSVSAKPAAPSVLTAKASGTSSITLTWQDNSTNETGFTLMQASSSGGIFNKLINIPANTVSYTDTGLGSGATYYYKIQAVNSGGSSAWSNEASARTESLPTVTIPSAPTNLRSQVSGCNAIMLYWSDNSSNETGFEISRSTTAKGTYIAVATVPANIISYTNSGLVKGRRYYYKIRAVNTAGSSAWSTSTNTVASCLTAVKSTQQLTENESQIKLYPNPLNQELVHLDLPDGTVFPVEVTVYSSSAQQLMSSEINECVNTLPTAGLPNGAYIIILKNSLFVQQLKLLINR